MSLDAWLLHLAGVVAISTVSFRLGLAEVRRRRRARPAVWQVHPNPYAAPRGNDLRSASGPIKPGAWMQPQPVPTIDHGHDNKRRPF